MYHNEELHGLYRSPNIVKMIKSRRLRWAGHVARMEETAVSFQKLPLKNHNRHISLNMAICAPFAKFCLFLNTPPILSIFSLL